MRNSQAPGAIVRPETAIRHPHTKYHSRPTGPSTVDAMAAHIDVLRPVLQLTSPVRNCRRGARSRDRARRVDLSDA